MTGRSPVFDIFCRQGTTLSLSFVWKKPNGDPYDLTGADVRMQVRPTADSDEVLLEVSTSSFGVVVDNAGRIALDVSSLLTAAMEPGDYVYDLFVTIGGGITRCLVSGSFSVEPRVTR